MDSDTDVDRGKFTFKTGDDTELFFKNVRQSDYDLEENKSAKFNVFRHEDRVTSDSVWLYPAIVVNYLQDEAYILLEGSNQLNSMDEWTVVTGTPGDTLILSSPNRENNLEFASRIFEAIKDDQSILIKSNGDFQPLFHKPEAAEAFRITMADYYRLTRIF